MRLLTFCLLVFLVFASPTFAYPQDQLEDCISSAQKNPNVKDVAESSIEQYCDCALTLIVDEGKEIRPSVNQCASNNFR